ncbi:MAG: DUF1289 domain-containing protein [Novosphingobium sp.]
MQRCSNRFPPCISVCRIDQRTGWCEGCRRTLSKSPTGQCSRRARSGRFWPGSMSAKLSKNPQAWCDPS